VWPCLTPGLFSFPCYTCTSAFPRDCFSGGVFAGTPFGQPAQKKAFARVPKGYASELLGVFKTSLCAVGLEPVHGLGEAFLEGDPGAVSEEV
jgi:hypothetical protein